MYTYNQLRRSGIFSKQTKNSPFFQNRNGAFLLNKFKKKSEQKKKQKQKKLNTNIDIIEHPTSYNTF